MIERQRLVRLAVVLLFAWQCSILELSGAHSQSPSERSSCSLVEPEYSIVHPKDRGGWNSLLRTAKSGREAIFNRDLPYQAISREISKVYNSSELETSPFIQLWLQQSLNALLLSGFVAVVGIALPCLMVALWTFWECCYEVDEEGEEDNRNLSRKAQIIAWSLSAALVLSLLLLAIFLLVLLVANSWVDEGVHQGGGVVGTVLPELVRIRNQSLDRVYNLTRNDLFILRQDLNNTVLSRVSSDVVKIVADTFSSEIDNLYSNISGELTLQESMKMEIALLLSRLAELRDGTSELYLLLSDVNGTIMNIIAQCPLLTDSSESGLAQLCNNVLSNQERYIPRISGGVAEFGGEGSLLKQLAELLNDPSFSQTENFNKFTDFLTELSYNLTMHVKVASDKYFGESSPLEQQLAAFNQDIGRYYSSLSFGWPQSQEQLNTFLGERYLQNWNMFRSVCTVTFVIITLLLGLCLLVAMAMGLWHVVTIYKSGEEEMNIEGAHQAGTMMKKLAFGFSVVCGLSAVFYGVFLCVVGVVDQGCGRHGNFSNLMRYVIDNNQTWGGSYPVGSAIFENGSYPLTVGDMLDGCHRNQSLFTVLQLAHRYNIDDIIDIPKTEGDNYFYVLRSFAKSLMVHDLFPSANKLRLLADVSTLPVNWTALISVTSDDLFQEGFVGLANLHDVISNLSALTNFTTLSEAASRNLTSYIEDIFLPHVVSMATSLRDDQSRLISTQLIEEIADVEGLMEFVVPSESREQLHLAAFAVIRELDNFTSYTKEALLCDTGFCHNLSNKYYQFSSALCDDVVQGLDLYWTTLIVILPLSLVVVLLSLVLACRFIDLELEKSNHQNKKFNLSSAVIRQIRAMFWFLLSNVVNLWLVVVISRDDYFHEMYCRAQLQGCCPTCVWAFGILFLIVPFVMGGGGRVYQCVVLYRINKFEAMKVRRYWMDRKKATQFYAQLTHFIQDVLFLIIAGSYVSGIETLTIPSSFSISLSIIGVITYLVYLIHERNSITSYFQWLKTEFHKRIKLTTQGAEPQTGNGQGAGGQSTMANGHRPGGGGRYGSSESEQSEDDSQGTTQPDADWMYNPNHLPTSAAAEHIPLPVIHEGSESMDQSNADDLEMSSSAPPHPPSHPNGVLPLASGAARLVRGHHRPMELDVDDSENELSQVQPNMTTIPLDNLNHEEYTASQIRIHRQQLHGADISSRHTDYAASTASYYSSNNSLTAASEMQQDYYSSSQAPDDHYDSSDYRDDYDSDYSHGYSQRYVGRRYLPPLSSMSGEMSVEV